VPLTIQRLVDHPDGMGFLRQLQGGIVGGAPVAAPLAEALGETRLRVGYGQTEASPGIALGAPGAWAANYLGRPLGCDVHLDADGEIHFQGPNACVGFWGEDGLDRRAPDRTVATGDLGTRDGDDLFFRGRTDDAFKLSNGKLVQAGAHEATLKEAFPELQDAFLFTHDGTNLTLALLPRTSASPPDPEALHSHLQSLAKRVHHVRVLDPASWQASKKGAVDRRAMARQLAGTDAEAGRSSPDAHDALSSSH
jgi:long-subunit acyl-CoA synthetase (AMP-forming)